MSRVRERLSAAAQRVWDAGGRGPIGLALAPTALLYRAAIGLRNRGYDAGLLPTHRAAVPVLSIGNIAVGGAGKTPFAAWAADRLEERGATPAVLHGGRTRDEPMLHAEWRPDRLVVAMTDRVAAAAEAVARGADAIVLDDGFQHRRLARDVDLVLIASERWSDRRPLLPQGPWREPASALRRAHAVVVTRKSADAERAERVAADIARLAPDVPCIRATILPAGWTDATGGMAGPPAGAALAVSGVADPGSFESGARTAGADVAAVMTFPDHHEYDAADAERIRRAAAGRVVVTTAKDWTKLRSHLVDVPVRVLRQEVSIEAGEDALHTLLDRIRMRPENTGVPADDGLA